MAKGDELPHNVKIFVVQRLASFDRPSEVVKAVKENFELEVSRQRVHYYDPTTRLGAALAPELKELFEKTREAFKKDVDSIPISHKAVQLRALDRALALAESRGQIAMVIPLVTAAAEISGTIVDKHQHEHSAPGGVPLTAAIFLTGAPAGASTPQTVVRVPQPSD